MTIIYKDFAEGFCGINESVVSDRMTLVDGHRTYLAQGVPYFDYVHFPKVSEPWGDHEQLQRHFRANSDLHGRVWAGTAGEVNLSYIAATKAPAVVLFDINPLQSRFWQEFFDFIAEIPQPHIFALAAREFLKGFYYTLRDEFNLEAIAKEYKGPRIDSPDPQDHMVSVEEQIRRRKASALFFNELDGGGAEDVDVDCSDITEAEPMSGDVEEVTSPVMNMNYKRFYKELRMRLGWKNSGGVFCGDKDVDWLINPENYRHLHLLAKNRAIAAVTLDVTDPASVAQLRKRLQHVSYTTYDPDLKTVNLGGDVIQGVEIGNIYLSNVLYYLNYSDEELAEAAEKGETPIDFTGAAITKDTFARTLGNLRSLVADDAYILRFDKTVSGVLGRPEFRPLFPVYVEGEAIVLPQADHAYGLSP